MNNYQTTRTGRTFVEKVLRMRFLPSGKKEYGALCSENLIGFLGPTTLYVQSLQGLSKHEHSLSPQAATNL